MPSADAVICSHCKQIVKNQFYEIYASRRFKGIAKGYFEEWFGKHRMFVEH